MSTLTEIERLQIVRRILHDAQSPNTPGLCRSLKQKNNQTYCATLLNRAHLWEVVLVDSTLKTLSKIEDCPQNDAWCITKVALKQSSNLESINASRTCTAIQNARSREECLFQVAEQLIENDNYTYFSDAFHICTQAPNFKEHCQAHLIEHLAQSKHKNPTIIQSLQLIEQSMEIFPHSPLEYFYSLRAMYFPNDTTLPFQHLHSVQTYQFLRDQPKEDHNLKYWIRVFKSYNQPFSQSKIDGHIRNYWVVMKHPKTYYMSIEQRPTSSDKGLDLELAMITGLAQHKFPLKVIRQEYSTGPIHQMLSKVNTPHKTNKH